MQAVIQGLKSSASIKALVIGGLILVLLIPVSMINGVVHDREVVHQDARWDIMRSWGQQQLIAGPVLIVPYTVRALNSRGEEVAQEGFTFVLPTALGFDTTVDPEIRYRGLHKVPIYRAELSMRGAFNKPDLARLGIRDAELHWNLAAIALSVSDARAIAEIPQIEFAGRKTTFEPGGAVIMTDMPPSIVANVGNVFTGGGSTAAFAMELHVKGSDSLMLAPLGDTTTVSMTSGWANPSFLGNYLPETREISDDGFSASWQISSLGRAMPSQWTSRSGIAPKPAESAFGVSFYMPVSLYQLTLRASNYAILFIGLSFVAYFLFEILANLRLHPLQYLLIGFANALFYLLLISLAEHMGFGWAYLISAMASTSLIAGYSTTVLRRRRRGLLMAAVLAGLYAFLYMTLKAETFALLAGATGLWVTLAIVMYLTRRIDWYGQGKGQAQAE